MAGRPRHRGRVERIVAGDRAEEMRAVAYGPRHRPDLIERRRVGDDAVAADAPVGGLEPDDAAVRRRLPDRAAGVGAERAKALARRDRCPRSTRRTPARAQCPGIVGAAVPNSRSTAHRELVAVGLADEDRASLAQAPRHRRIVRRDERFQDARAASCGPRC
jgi:hypothetical protein